MAEDVRRWWARRQWSRGAEVPYPVGTYRAAWASFPALIRQYHPELNAGITLTQIPPAADVLLLWQCETGHLFVATPGEQRSRPGRERRRSSWCPECAAGAQPRRIRPTPTAPGRPSRPARRRARELCPLTPDLPPGTAFASACAPKPASAIEARFRMRLAERIAFAPELTAVRLAHPFFQHLEVWPDIALAELRVAIEWDTTGRHGLEHVGPREDVDRRKDRALRSVGWEVIRIRTGRLPALGPHDLAATGLTRDLVPRVLDELREIRGPLLVDAWLR